MTDWARSNERHDTIRLTVMLGISGPERLDQMVHARLRAGSRHLAVDMARVGHVDSMGIAMLVTASLAVRSAGGRLVLLHSNPRVRRVLSTVGLLDYFEGRAEMPPAVLEATTV